VRLSNVPVPEPQVAAILGAAALHALLPLRLPLPRRAGWLLGGPMLAAGIGLVAWAVRSAGDTDLEGDSDLLTTGAYAVSRNPMYLGWSVAVLGLALGTRSAWLLAAWRLAVSALDREIDREELRLLQRFGPAHAAYRDLRPRW
jgi:protein-S-isoprenylcysteine O-methyltransferase Ste14